MAGRLAIDRLDAAYAVARDHPSPDAVRWRLDGVLRDRAAPLCGELVERGLAGSDESSWFVRAVSVELTLDLGVVDDDRLARAWAGAAASAILSRMAAGPDGDAVVRFDDEADHVAVFAADLAAGRAWDRWYHHGFDSLRALPAGTAVLTALRRDPASAGRVVALLAGRRQLGRVVSLLSEREAAGVRALLAPLAPGRAAGMTGAGRLLGQAMEAWMARAPAALGWGPDRMALVVHGRLLAEASDVWSSAAGGAAVELLARLASVAGGPAEATASVAGVPGEATGGPAETAGAAGGWPGPAGSAGVGGAAGDAGPRVLAAAVSAALAGGPGAILAMARRADPEAAAAIAVWAAGLPRPVGVPERIGIAEAPPPTGRRPSAISEARHGRGDVPGGSPAPPVAARGEAVAFASRWAAVFLLLPSLLELEVPALERHDALRLLTLLKAAGAAGERRAADDRALRLAAGFAAGTQRTRGFRTASRELRRALGRQGRLGGQLVLDRLSGRAEALRDTLHDEWLFLGARGGAVRALPRLRTETGVALELTGRRRAADLDQAVSGVSRAADRAAALLANAVLRRFAHRLPGLQRSSGPYLVRSFLAGRGWVTAGRDLVDVQLTGIPLHLVLRLAGFQGMVYRVPWLPGTAIRVTLVEEMP